MNNFNGVNSAVFFAFDIICALIITGNKYLTLKCYFSYFDVQLSLPIHLHVQEHIFEPMDAQPDSSKGNRMKRQLPSKNKP